MKPKKFTLKFINNGKDKKVCLRYFVTVDGKDKTLDVPANCYSFFVSEYK